jgi:Ca2+-binding RTX toxin-like protein
MPLITGTTNNDLLTGTAGSDTMLGLDGDDILNPLLGFDTVDGGSGIDVLTVDYSALSTNINQYSSFSSTKLLFIISTISNQIIYGNIERFNLRGGSGNDRFFGGNLNDTLSGGAGNDTLNGGGGVDSLDGGAGIDTLIDADFSTATTALNFNISGTTILGAVTLPNGSVIKGFELFTNVKGGSGNDRLRITSPTRVNNTNSPKSNYR